KSPQNVTSPSGSICAKYQATGQRSWPNVFEKSVKYSGTSSGATSGTKDVQAFPRAESRKRRRFSVFRSLTRSVICRVFVGVPFIVAGSKTKPFHESPDTPKVSF